MNRLLLGMLALTLTTVLAQVGAGQAPAFPPGGPYAASPARTAQPAVYMQMGGQPSAVYPAMGGMMPPGRVQLANGVAVPVDGQTIASGPVYGGPVYGEPVYEGPVYGGSMEGGAVYGPGPVYSGAPPMYAADPYAGGQPYETSVGSGCAGDCAGGCDGDCSGGSGGLFGGCGLLGGCGWLRGCGLLGGCGDGGCYGGGEGCGSGLLDGHCFGGYGHCGKKHGPYGSGGCCLPRWYDVHAEWLFWKRDYDESLSFSSNGILGPDALNANQLDFSEESGFRVTAAYLIGVATNVEASYFGQLNWASGANATSDGNLFSVFSNFGSDPLNGFPETDFGFLHEIALSSELDNGEINVRHRWVSANCLLHSSVLVGARYFRLQEDLLYNTYTDLGAMNYRVKTDNDLVGSQLGGDLYLCVTPRFKVGAEVEAGVYGTSSSQRTTMFSTNSPSIREYERDNDVAFLGEAGVMALFRVSSQFTLRFGYQVLYVDGVALAMDNFNTASPFTARDSFLDNDGDVFYHGATVGFEWTH